MANGDATSVKSQARVAVLGAGPMGLAVAYQLAREGTPVVVFEADDRVGGMSASFDFNGLRIERYYHFHCTSDVEVTRVLDELNMADRMHWVSTKMGYYYQSKLHPWGTALSLLRFPGLGLIDKFRYGLHAFMSTRLRDWSRLDSMDAKTWIRTWVGERAFNVLWKQLFEHKFYHFGDNLSAAWIWSRIRRLGLSRDRMFRERLGYIDGGSETILDAMRDFIVESGGEVRLSAPVSRVVIEDGVARGVMVGDVLHPFDVVVSTIPLPYVPRILGDLPAAIVEQYRALSYIAVVCVVAKLRRPLTDKFWLNVSDPSMDIPGLVEYTNLRPMAHHLVYVPYYLPGEHPKYAESDQVFIHRVKGYMRTINPALTDDDFIDVRASRYRFAQPICEPRFLERLPPMQLPVRGLLVADTSHYYPEDRGMSESIGLGRKMAGIVNQCLQTSSSPSSVASSSPAESPR